MLYTLTSFVIQLGICASLALLPYFDDLHEIERTALLRDIRLKLDNCHNFGETDQHVPGNNVEAAQDRLMFVLNLLGLRKMASCSYSSLLENDSTSCGANWKNPEDIQCIALKDCNKACGVASKSI